MQAILDLEMNFLRIFHLSDLEHLYPDLLGKVEVRQVCTLCLKNNWILHLF